MFEFQNTVRSLYQVLEVYQVGIKKVWLYSFQAHSLRQSKCSSPHALNQLSRHHLWVQAQEDAQLYIFNRSEIGMPGEVGFYNANVCKLLQYFSPSTNEKTTPAVYCKTLTILKRSSDHSINSPSDILPFNKILGERLDIGCSSDQIGKQAPVCLGLTLPTLQEQNSDQVWNLIASLSSRRNCGIWI